MAAPNLASPTTITGKTTYLTLANTNETDLLANAAASGKALRLTSLIVSNTSGAGSADATVTIYSAASGGTGYRLASTVAIPANASVVVLSRDASMYLEEDRRVTVRASAANYLTFIVSYEDVA